MKFSFIHLISRASFYCSTCVVDGGLQKVVR